MNAGFNDAWYSPATDGQGFYITVFPNLGTVALAWFTYDTELPLEDAKANLGSAGHRWLTALGPYEGNTAELTIYLTKGGVFGALEPAPTTDLAGIGTISLDFADCTQGLVNYEINSLGLTGEIPIQRVAADNISLCETLPVISNPLCHRKVAGITAKVRACCDVR